MHKKEMGNQPNQSIILLIFIFPYLSIHFPHNIIPFILMFHMYFLNKLICKVVEGVTYCLLAAGKLSLCGTTTTYSS